MFVQRFEVRDRGATPRGLRKIMNAAQKESYFEVGVEYQSEYSDLRFTNRHATAAGYADRSKNYERRKLRLFGHTRPLEYSGTSRRLSRVANITATSKGVTVRWPGLRVFNFSNPKMRANMAEEFTKVLPDEAEKLTRSFDQKLDQKINAYKGENK